MFSLAYLKYAGVESIRRRNRWQCWWFYFVFIFRPIKNPALLFFCIGRKRKQCLTRNTVYTRRHTKTSCLSMCGVSNISRTWSRWQNGNTASGSHDDGNDDDDDEDFDAQSLRFPLHISPTAAAVQLVQFFLPPFALHIYIGFAIGD